MAYDFPSSPTLGQVYQGWTWDGEKWVATGALRTPLNFLTGLIGWWDASVTASLTLSGSDIMAIADQSGGGNHLSWTGTNKPQYNATGFNSRPAFVLGGQTLASAFTNASFPLGTGNTLTLWWVGRFVSATSGTDNPPIFSYKAPGQSNDYGNSASFTVFRSTPYTNIQLMRNSVGTNVSCSKDADHRVIITVNSSGVQTFYVDGVATTAATTAGNWASSGVLIIGRNAGFTAYYAGPHGEAGIATGYSDATTVGQLDSYLKTRWGL